MKVLRRGQVLLAPHARPADPWTLADSHGAQVGWSFHFP
jgi:hypothetical protein